MKAGTNHFSLECNPYFPTEFLAYSCAKLCAIYIFLSLVAKHQTDRTTMLCNGEASPLAVDSSQGNFFLFFTEYRAILIQHQSEVSMSSI